MAAIFGRLTGTVLTPEEKLARETVLRDMVLAWVGSPIRDITLEPIKVENSPLGEEIHDVRVHVAGVHWSFAVEGRLARTAYLTGLQTLALSVLLGKPCGRELVDELIGSGHLDPDAELVKKARADERERCAAIVERDIAEAEESSGTAFVASWLRTIAGDIRDPKITPTPAEGSR